MVHITIVDDMVNSTIMSSFGSTSQPESQMPAKSLQNRRIFIGPEPRRSDLSDTVHKSCELIFARPLNRFLGIPFCQRGLVHRVLDDFPLAIQRPGMVL